MNLLRKTNDSSLAFSTPTSSNLKFGMAVSLPAAWSSGKSRKATQTPHCKHLRCAAHLHNLRRKRGPSSRRRAHPSQRKKRRLPMANSNGAACRRRIVGCGQRPLAIGGRPQRDGAQASPGHGHIAPGEFVRAITRTGRWPGGPGLLG